jgi:hypothetical protein
MMWAMLAAAVDNPPILPPPAIGLFESVCLNGQAQLKPDDVERISADRLPTKARILLHSNGAAGNPNEKYIDALPGSSLPKTVYRIAAPKPTYLIIPDAGAASGYRSTCAVFVEDDVYSQAIRAVARVVYGTDANVKDPAAADMSFGGAASGYVVMAARMNGATLLSAIKDPTYPHVEKQKK